MLAKVLLAGKGSSPYYFAFEYPEPRFVTAPAVTYPPPTPTAPYTALPRARVDSVDLLRGIIMVIMLLDHTRDFAHFQSTAFDPTDVARTTPMLFFTRWITHFCAPLFVFLAGTGAYFQVLRGKPKAELSRFLVTRGLWLIVLELTVLRVIIFFNFDFAQLAGFIQVIWAIGWSMIVLAALIHLPERAIAAFGTGMILIHNAFDGVTVASFQGPGSPVPGFWATIWHILHVPGVIFPLGAGGPTYFVLYPLIPWIGVMAAGYAFGAVYRLDQTTRRRVLIRMGTVITLGFFVLRFINAYGDPAPWSHQDTLTKTILSFFRVSKYPPSLLFLAMTIGPAMFFLAWAERGEGIGQQGASDAQGFGRTVRSFFITYGRVPLFFYILQWIAAHVVPIAASLLVGKPIDFFFEIAPLAPPPPAGTGFGLFMVYVLWIVGVLLLYPLCRWYARLKARRTDWWLSYL